MLHLNIQFNTVFHSGNVLDFNNVVPTFLFSFNNLLVQTLQIGLTPCSSLWTFYLVNILNGKTWKLCGLTFLGLFGDYSNHRKNKLPPSLSQKTWIPWRLSMYSSVHFCPGLAQIKRSGCCYFPVLRPYVKT